jgi:hypothetical protein
MAKTSFVVGAPLAASSSAVVWLDESVPYGAVLRAEPAAWSYGARMTAPFSGRTALESDADAGAHQLYFTGAPAVSVSAAESLFAYVWLDPANPPAEVMLQWQAEDGWEHRAYWGADRIGWGIPGTVSRLRAGDLPAAGQWTRLEVPASAVGLAGRSVTGAAFTLYGGHAAFDRAGKAPANRAPLASITAPMAGSVYAAGDPITLAASGYDFDGKVAKVEFLLNGVKVGERLAAPYTLTLSTGLGDYSAAALVIDDLGARTMSAPRAFSVRAGDPAPTLGAQVWVDDQLPLGAKIGIEGGDYSQWGWQGADPAPYSGARAIRSGIAYDIHQYYFTSASTPMLVAQGQTLYAYVWLDPLNPPQEVMLQWMPDDAGDWDHRAYWGADKLTWGAAGTASRYRAGALPPLGQWVRLEVPASAVGLEGRAVRGMAFSLFAGRGAFDRAGKDSRAAGGSAVYVMEVGLPAAVRSESLRAELSLPAGALAEPATVTLEAVEGQAFEVGPSGLALARAATLTLPYQGAVPPKLYELTESGTWREVPNARADARTRTVSASIRRLGRYAARVDAADARSNDLSPRRVLALPKAGGGSRLRVALAAPADGVAMTVYSVSGRLQGQLSVRNAGLEDGLYLYEADWGSGRPAGLYMVGVRVTKGGATSSVKMTPVVIAR